MLNLVFAVQFTGDPSVRYMFPQRTAIRPRKAKLAHDAF